MIEGSCSTESETPNISRTLESGQRLRSLICGPGQREGDPRGGSLFSPQPRTVPAAPLVPLA